MITYLLDIGGLPVWLTLPSRSDALVLATKLCIIVKGFVVRPGGEL